MIRGLSVEVTATTVGSHLTASEVTFKQSDLRTARQINAGIATTDKNVAANQKLSEARAAAVTAYLMTSAGISPALLLPAASLGSSPIADDPRPPSSDADARRVTVTIAVSKSSPAAASAQ